MNFYVYAHLKPDLTPFYIGKGTFKRANSLASSRRNERYGRTVKKYGEKNIVIETLQCKTEAEAFLREKLVIMSLKSVGIKLCNMTDGGEGASGCVKSDATRTKLSRSNSGKKQSPEHIAKRVLKQVGQKRTPEQRERISKSHVGKTVSYEARMKISLANFGRVVSEETRQKIAKKQKGVLRGPMTKEARVAMSVAAKVGWEKRRLK